jgi:hypothetical protein
MGARRLVINFTYRRRLADASFLYAIIKVRLEGGSSVNESLSAPALENKRIELSYTHWTKLNGSSDAERTLIEVQEVLE